MPQLDAQKLKELIENSQISDEEVFNAIKEFTADQCDANGNLIPMTLSEIQMLEELGTITGRLRPGVIKCSKTIC